MVSTLTELFSKVMFSFPPKSKLWHYAKRRFPVTLNLRYMYEVLNVDEIKNWLYFAKRTF